MILMIHQLCPHESHLLHTCVIHFKPQRMTKRLLSFETARSVPDDVWIAIVRSLLPGSAACLTLLSTCHSAMRWIIPVLKEWNHCGWHTIYTRRLLQLGFVSWLRDARLLVHQMGHLSKQTDRMTDSDLRELLYCQVVYDYRRKKYPIPAQHKYQVRQALISDNVHHLFYRNENAWKQLVSAPNLEIHRKGNLHSATGIPVPIQDLFWYIGPEKNRATTLDFFVKQCTMEMPLAHRLTQLYERYV